MNSSSTRSQAAPAEGAGAVEAAGLAKRYGRTWALRGIDLRVAPGEAVVVLGPNGSGKSTLLRILATAATPTRGELRVLGISPRADADGIRQRVGLLSSQTFLYAELTALENLRFAAVMYGLSVPESALRAALAGVGLDRVAGARVRTFSSGMAKRLAVVRATLHEPDLLLLDEPHAALDAEGLQWLDAFLAAARRAGKTLLLATHQMERGVALCDRAIALRAGRVVFDGPVTSFAASSTAAGVE